MIVIQKFECDSITDDLMGVAARFFTQNYGVWGAVASEKMGVKAGARIKMSSKNLKQKILPPKAHNIYVRLLEHDELVGHVFATRWDGYGRSFLWVTQLCVSRAHRNQGKATRLLSTLHFEHPGCVVGILSSHPFAISAVLRVFGKSLTCEDLRGTKAWAARAIRSCPVGYVRNAECHGMLHEDEVVSQDQVVSCADTKFWVDHEEPMEALRVIEQRKKIPWPFGILPEGHEFLVLVDQQQETKDFQGEG